jgi:hypothetical protein
MSNVAAATADFEHLAATHFQDTAYIQSEGEPWIGVFGPIELESPAEWTQVAPEGRLFTLWGEQAEAGGAGEFAWIWAGNGTDHLAAVENFSAGAGARVGVAYPGFQDFYDEGGWGPGLGWEIAHNLDGTFNELLAVANSHANNLEALQIATWNDFGEGTMIEPTHEMGFAHLEALQAFTGVGYGLAELELIHELYLARKENATDSDIQALLDEVYQCLISLDVEGAREKLGEI